VVPQERPAGRPGEPRETILSVTEGLPDTEITVTVGNPTSGNPTQTMITTGVHPSAGGRGMQQRRSVG
jgi:hypothetical protein